MLDLSPQEIDDYYAFFPRLKSAIEQSARGDQALQGKSALQILEIKDESAKRELQRAVSGGIWFQKSVYVRIRRLILSGHCDPHFLALLDESQRIYEEISHQFKYGNSPYWGTAHIARSSIKTRFDNLRENMDLRTLLTDDNTFSAFVKRHIGQFVENGKQAIAITNAHVIVEFLIMNRRDQLKFVEPPLFIQRVIQVTRAGGWASQLVGQWHKFEYFSRITSAMAVEDKFYAKIVENEHHRHRQRRQKLTLGSSEFGAATAALRTFIKANAFNPEQLDPVLLLNAADEFLDRGYTSDIIPKGLDNVTIKHLLETAELCEKSKPVSLGIKISRMTLTASMLMNDGKLDEAERTLIDAGLKLPFDERHNQSRRGLALIRGKIGILRGNIDNEFLDSSRQICLAMGAFHKVKEIDSLRRRKDIERPP